MQRTVPGEKRANLNCVVELILQINISQLGTGQHLENHVLQHQELAVVPHALDHAVHVRFVFQLDGEIGVPASPAVLVPTDQSHLGVLLVRVHVANLTEQSLKGE